MRKALRKVNQRIAKLEKKLQRAKRLGNRRAVSRYSSQLARAREKKQELLKKQAKKGPRGARKKPRRPRRPRPRGKPKPPKRKGRKGRGRLIDRIRARRKKKGKKPIFKGRKRRQERRKKRKKGRLKRLDRFYGKKLTPKNARKAQAFYAAALASGNPAWLPYKGYLSRRLKLARRMASKAKKLRENAEKARKAAKAARARRDVAASTRYEAQAVQLEQAARTEEIRESQDLPGDFENAGAREPMIEQATEEYLPAVDDVSEDDLLEETEEDELDLETMDDMDLEEPWYSRPVTWVVTGLVVAAGVAVVAVRRKGRQGSRRSASPRTPTASFQVKRKRGAKRRRRRVA